MPVLICLIGLAFMVGPFFVPGLPPFGRLAVAALGLVILLLGLVMLAISNLYRKTSADQAFVRTGLQGARVYLDSGTIVLPVVHRLTEVNLKTMKLGVNPKGGNALITRDNLRADVLAQFYIRVQADHEHILNAARSLGQNSVNAETVEALVSEKLVSALRAIASQMDLFEIHTKRDEFAERVKEHVRTDLEANGLLLESVTISELDQTNPSELSDNNVFDAQGKRKITEITAAALVERNRIEREAEKARRERDVLTRQEILQLEQRQAEAEALQTTEIAKIRAAKEREAQEAQIQQQQAIETAKILQARAVQQAEIERTQTVEVARVEQERAVQAAGVLREQTLRTAQVERDMAVSLAERAKEIAVAQQEAERARAERAALEAQAAREAASQEVLKVQQLSEAQREAEKRLIAAKQVIEQDKIKQQTEAEVVAYSRVKQAEAEQESAAKQASARLELANADSRSRKLVAEGEAAVQMVPVQVDRERVNVKEAEVNVERRQLENRQEFAQAGIELEIQRLRITAEKEVQIEFARSLGQVLGQGHMTIYGSPETAETMLANLTRGMGFRTMAEGFLNGAGSGSSGSGDTLAQLGGALKPALDRLTSGSGDGKITPLLEAIKSDPAIAAAVAEALAAALPAGGTATAGTTAAAPAENGVAEKAKSTPGGPARKSSD